MAREAPALKRSISARNGSLTRSSAARQSSESDRQAFTASSFCEQFPNQSRSMTRAPEAAAISRVPSLE